MKKRCTRNIVEDVFFPNEVVKANVRGDSLIKAWRVYKGLTQEGLARKAQISQSTLAWLERPGAIPRKSYLIKLAQAMEITFRQLVE